MIFRNSILSETDIAYFIMTIIINIGYQVICERKIFCMFLKALPITLHMWEILSGKKD